MSQHSSLKIDSVGVKHRNVLSRLERIRRLEKEHRWTEGSKIFGLPKVKSMKIKVKKVKEAKEVKEGAAAETAPGSAQKTAEKKPAETKAAK